MIRERFRILKLNPKQKHSHSKPKYIIQQFMTREWLTIEYPYGNSRFSHSFTVETAILTLLQNSYKLLPYSLEEHVWSVEVEGMEFLELIEDYKQKFPEFFI